MAQLPSPALPSLGQRGKGKAKASSKGSSKGKPAYELAVTLEQFISQMMPLVDLEKVLLRSLFANPVRNCLSTPCLNSFEFV